jgi:hypothetical protein
MDTGVLVPQEATKKNNLKQMPTCEPEHPLIGMGLEDETRFEIG